MNKNPLISVVVTTYNRKNYLAETLNSIINQSYKNMEVLVIDNFSNYNFFEHIASFQDKRLFPYQHQNNGKEVDPIPWTLFLET